MHVRIHDRLEVECFPEQRLVHQRRLYRTDGSAGTIYGIVARRTLGCPGIHRVANLATVDSADRGGRRRPAGHKGDPPRRRLSRGRRRRRRQRLVSRTLAPKVCGRSGRRCGRRGRESLSRSRAPQGLVGLAARCLCQGRSRLWCVRRGGTHAHRREGRVVLQR